MTKSTQFIITLLSVMFMLSTVSLKGEALQANPKVTITGDMSLKSLVEQIEQKTSYTFVFNTSVDLNQLVSANFRNENVIDILKKAFEGKGISYEFIGTQIILKNAAVSPPTQITQGRLIKGTVRDDAGEPLIGATVKILGTTTATLTDVDGGFYHKCAIGIYS